MWWLLVALPVAGYLGLRYLEAHVTQEDYEWVFPLLLVAGSVALAYLILR